jgi:flagellar assembly protein FliH
MAKAVFRPGEMSMLGGKIFLDPPDTYFESARAPAEAVVEEVVEADAYTGPTAEEMRQEAELFKAQWETEKAELIGAAKAEAEGIIKAAREAAALETQRQADQAQADKQAAGAEAEKLLAGAQQKAAEIESGAENAFESGRKDAEEQGRAAGREAGFAEGRAEVDRLIERTRTVLERAQDKREDILEQTEQQIVDLVLLISRKVIKVISESQRSVVISNVEEALKKVKGRGTITVRVNIADVKLTTEHINEFLQKMEGTKTIQVEEDSTVESGGCIVETDFGEIDARIASQLAELESRILELSPIKSKPRSASGERV